jgi:hypothetical protein
MGELRLPPSSLSPDRLLVSKKQDKMLQSWMFNGRNRKDGGTIRSIARVNYERKKHGKMGAASDVRRIDPLTGEVVEIIPKNRRK